VQVQGYYEVAGGLCTGAFHSFAAHNVGHLLWDDFYPIFSLLRLFGLPGGDLSKSQSKSERQKKLMMVEPGGRDQIVRCTRPVTFEATNEKCAANFTSFCPSWVSIRASFGTSDIRLAYTTCCTGGVQT
jgi:hypothetical protein